MNKKTHRSLNNWLIWKILSSQMHEFWKRLHSVYTKSFRVKWPRMILQRMKSFLHNICNTGKFWGLLHTESEVTKEMEPHYYSSDWLDFSSFTPCGPVKLHCTTLLVLRSPFLSGVMPVQIFSFSPLSSSSLLSSEVKNWNVHWTAEQLYLANICGWSELWSSYSPLG